MFLWNNADFDCLFIKLFDFHDFTLRKLYLRNIIFYLIIICKKCWKTLITSFINAYEKKCFIQIISFWIDYFPMESIFIIIFLRTRPHNFRSADIFDPFFKACIVLHFSILWNRFTQHIFLKHNFSCSNLFVTHLHFIKFRLRYHF